MLPRYFSRVVALVVVLAAVSFGSAQDKPAPKFQLDADVIYRKVDGKEVKLDLAYPKESKGLRPAVICVHGGAWRMGNRKDLRNWIEYLAENGYVAASISYRLLPDGKWPGQIEDCKTAVRFLRANAEKYQIDADKIGALGYSAGGHLVCLLGTTDAKHGFDGAEYPKMSSKVQAVVSYFGPTDLSHWSTDDSAQNAVFQPMLGARFKEKPEAYEKASPICYCCKEAPPFLFFHGTADRIVPIEQSRKMCEKLKDVGAQARIIEIKDADHGWGGKDSAMTTSETLKFLGEHLRK